MLLQGKIPPHPPKTNKIRDEFVERDAGTRGYAYLPRICDSNTPPAVLDFRCSVSMTSMNKKGKKNEENLVKIVGIERCERAGWNAHLGAIPRRFNRWPPPRRWCDGAKITQNLWVDVRAGEIERESVNPREREYEGGNEQARDQMFWIKMPSEFWKMGLGGGRLVDVGPVCREDFGRWRSGGRVGSTGSRMKRGTRSVIAVWWAWEPRHERVILMTLFLLFHLNFHAKSIFLLMYHCY